MKRSNGALTGGGLALTGIIISALMLSVGTVGILAAIAIPNFLMFQARAKQAEAKANPRAMGAELRAFEEQHHGAVPHAFAELGPAPEAQRYTYDLGKTDTVLPKLGERLDPPPGLNDAEAWSSRSGTWTRIRTSTCGPWTRPATCTTCRTTCTTKCRPKTVDRV